MDFRCIIDDWQRQFHGNFEILSKLIFLSFSLSLTGHPAAFESPISICRPIRGDVDCRRIADWSAD